MTYSHLLITTALILSGTACSQKTLQLDTYLQSNQCGISTQKLMYITSQNELDLLFTQGFNNPIKNLPSVDFNQMGLILVAMGQQANAGYSIQLNNTSAQLENEILSIDARFSQPSKDSVTAQVITTPCAVYQIDKLPITEVKLLQNQDSTRSSSAY